MSFGPGEGRMGYFLIQEEIMRRKKGVCFRNKLRKRGDVFQTKKRPYSLPSVLGEK